MNLNLYRVRARVDNGMEIFNTSAYVFAVSVEAAKLHFIKQRSEDDLVKILGVGRIEPRDGLVFRT